MGTVVLILAVAVVTASTTVVRHMRRASPVISRLSGLLLVLAGGYVTWYGWFELRVLAGRATSDPVVSAALAVQGALTRAVAGLGATVLAVAAGLVAALDRRYRQRPDPDRLLTPAPTGTSGDVLQRTPREDAPSALDRIDNAAFARPVALDKFWFSWAAF